MKLQYLKENLICYVLAIMFVFQGCTVYKKAPVTLEEAKLSNSKTLVVTNENLKTKYIRIIEIDGKYYGELKSNKNQIKILLTENEIKTIRVLDKTTSTIGNIAIVIGSAGLIVLIVAGIELSNMDFGGDCCGGAF